jgi:hypothetical protein
LKKLASLDSSKGGTHHMVLYFHFGFSFQDPRTEMRAPDFIDFKKKVDELLHQGKLNEAKKFVKEHKNEYCIKRKFNTIAEMANYLGLRKCTQTVTNNKL